MSSTQFQGDAIYWVEVDKIVPNPYQPRREFDEERLQDLAESIRMYGVLQPLTVTRREVVRDDGGMTVEYELIAGERRHRASKIAGLSQVPVIIRSGPENAKVKLELAIIENLQREDLNAVDRARAFKQLADEFGLNNTEIAKKMGKSREYVSNTLRILALPDHMLRAITDAVINEGHARPLLMLKDRPEQQETLFREITIKKMNVREAERIARSIAQDKIRKKRSSDPKIKMYEEKIAQSLGTRVHIEEKQVGGKLVIDFFTQDDLQGILDLIEASMLRTERTSDDMLARFVAQTNQQSTLPNSSTVHSAVSDILAQQHVPVQSVDHSSHQYQSNPYNPHITPSFHSHSVYQNDNTPSSNSFQSTVVTDTIESKEFPVSDNSSYQEISSESTNIPSVSAQQPFSSHDPQHLSQSFVLKTEQQNNVKSPERSNDDDDLYSISNFTV